MDKKILILGKVPPPIGGVTIHVQRLLQSLDKDKLPYTFVALQVRNLNQVLKLIAQHNVVHLHTSNSYVRLLLLLLLKVWGKKKIFTLHGNLLRYGWFKNTIDLLAIKLADIPIVINQGSYELAKIKNPKTQLLSAFIPPIKVQPLEEKVKQDLLVFTNCYKTTFCTNAFNLTFDKNGREIYGISDLIHLFKKMPTIGLIFSDPSGAYSNFFKEKNIELTDNICVLKIPHDFVNILNISDGFIRSTTTDGDSLSVKEALFYNKIVICSDCVNRPDGCILYPTNDKQALRKVILENQEGTKHKKTIQNAYPELKKIYKLASR